MKTITNIISCVLIGALIWLIIISVMGRADRSVELQSNLASAVEETVEILGADKKYSIENVNAYLADFVESIAAALDADSEIEVKVMQTDMEKAALSLKVAEIYKHPNGREGRVACEKTVILNKVEKPEREVYTVTFYSGKEELEAGKVYKIYRIEQGETVSAPAAPLVSGKTFAGWKDENDYLADFAQPVIQDLVYYGTWK